MKSIKDCGIRSFQVLLCDEICLNINGFQVGSFPSVLEEEVQAVKNAEGQSCREKNPGRVDTGNHCPFQY